MYCDILCRELGLEEDVATGAMNLLLKDGVVDSDGMLDRAALRDQALPKYLGVRGSKRSREEDEVRGLVERLGRLGLQEVGGGGRRGRNSRRRRSRFRRTCKSGHLISVL